MGTEFLAGPSVIGKGEQFQTKRGQIQTTYKQENFYDEGDEKLEQVAQKGGSCPMPGNIQGQFWVGL